MSMREGHSCMRSRRRALAVSLRVSPNIAEKNEMNDGQMTWCTRKCAGCVIEKSYDKAVVAHSVMGSTVARPEPMSAEAQTSSRAS